MNRQPSQQLNKPAAFIILITIIMLVIGGGVILFSNSEIQKGSNTVLTINKYSSNSNKQIVWKTYINNEFGFQIEYPEDTEVHFIKESLMLVMNKEGSSNEYPVQYILDITVGDAESKGIEEYVQERTLENGSSYAFNGISGIRVENVSSDIIYIGTFFVDEDGRFFEFYIEQTPTGGPDVFKSGYQEQVVNNYNQLITSFYFL